MRPFAFINRSIKRRVILYISMLLAVSMIVITSLVVSIVYAQMSEQTSKLLNNKAQSVQQRVEQRVRYLIENTALLTKNELMINALTDAEGRKNYLPPLVDNFILAKDVLSLNIVDFDGRAIFQTQEQIAKYNESEKLRNALAMGMIDYYIDEKSSELVVLSPIEYYSTTQGAAVVVFALSKIIERNLIDDKSLSLELLKGDKLIYSFNYDSSIDYQKSSDNIESQSSLFAQLGISLKLGVDENIYTLPVKEVIAKLLLLSLILITIGVWLARVLAESITEPILELYKRVTESKPSGDNFCSPIGTQDEIEELAKAFDKRTLLLQYQAEHDALTSLPNRLLFLDRLRESIKNAPRHKAKFALLFIDLDHFKEVNDSFGHDFGDELLLIIGGYLEGAVRQSDSVARMGGDEFTILINDAHDINTIVPILQAIMQLFVEPFLIKHHKFYITCSIGVALYPLNGTTAELLLKNADAAMYRAKDEGRNNYKFYTEDMTRRALERITLETELRQAIDKREFEVYYQLQVDMRDASIIGMEALVRWNHPTKGLVFPDKFIPLAEETGLIVEIDKQVTCDAMEQFSRWKSEGLCVGVLSVNLSMIQLNYENFFEFVKESLEQAKMSAKSFMFEVTETQVMKNPESAIIMLNELKELGIRLAVDDFGTGHSSLSYLKQLPIDKLKIDQSFTRDIFLDEDDAELTRAIISIAKSLRLELIAEGVETQEHAEFLMRYGCVEAQGYYYYKPQNAQRVTDILKAKRQEISLPKKEQKR